MFTLAELRAHYDIGLQIRQEARRVLDAALSRNMGYRDISRRYGIGGYDGSNVRHYLNTPLSLDSAYAVLRGELSGGVAPVKAVALGAAKGWGW